jgi:hypothetical protein
MPRVEFEPTTPAFGQAKTVHALDRSASVGSALETLRDEISAYASPNFPPAHEYWKHSENGIYYVSNDDVMVYIIK